MKERVLHEFIDLHNGGFVTTSVAIVGSREHGDDVAVVGPVVTIHHQLMSSGDQFQIVRVIELLRNILSKRVAGTSGRDTPTTSVIRIGPQKITDRTFVGNLHNTIKLLDLVQSVNRWREATMEAEDVVLNDGTKWKVIEQSCEFLPHLGIAILAQALIVESIDLSDLLRLVVTAQNGDTVGIADLQADEEGDGLNGVVTTIDIVTHEKIIVVGKLTANFEKLIEIVELAVDVTTDGNRGAHRHNIRLLN